MNKTDAGFTLVEMAIVLVIVGVLLGGLLPTISSQIEQQHRNETRKQLDEIQQALMGYAIAKGYFPCPAKSATDGAEDRNVSGACNKRQGFIPWSELSVSKLDSWGRIFRYSVTPAYANSVTRFKLGDPRDITIFTRDTAGALVNLSNTNDVPVVVMSHGKNGFGATLDNGTATSNTSTSTADEQTNFAAAGTSFVSKDQSISTTGLGEFDDLVIWISPNTLFSRMVAAGKLP